MPTLQGVDFSMHACIAINLMKTRITLFQTEGSSPVSVKDEASQASWNTGVAPATLHPAP